MCAFRYWTGYTHPYDRRWCYFALVLVQRSVNRFVQHCMKWLWLVVLRVCKLLIRHSISFFFIRFFRFANTSPNHNTKLIKFIRWFAFHLIFRFQQKKNDFHILLSRFSWLYVYTTSKWLLLLWHFIIRWMASYAGCLIFLAFKTILAFYLSFLTSKCKNNSKVMRG